MDGQNFNNGYEQQPGQQTQEQSVYQNQYQQPVYQNQYQQPMYGQPMYGNPVPVQQTSKSNGMSIAGMVLGIVGIVLGCCWGLVGVICGVVGLILSVMGNKKSKNGIAVAGIVQADIFLHSDCYSFDTMDCKKCSNIYKRHVSSGLKQMHERKELLIYSINEVLRAFLYEKNDDNSIFGSHVFCRKNHRICSALHRKHSCRKRNCGGNYSREYTFGGNRELGIGIWCGRYETYGKCVSRTTGSVWSLLCRSGRRKSHLSDF